MTTLARIASALLAASTVVAPLTAFAKPSKPPVAAEAKAPAHEDKPKADKSGFPMKGEDFKKMVDKRIDTLKTRLDKRMDHRKVPAADRAEIDKAVEAAVKEVHTAVDKAAADGVVTKDEAKQVRELAEQLRGKLQAELGAGKHAKKGAKGKHREHK